MVAAHNGLGTWHEPAVDGDAPCPRGGHAMCRLDDCVVLFGGADRQLTTFSDIMCLKLGPKGKRVWSKVEPDIKDESQVICRTGATITALDGHFYMYGGQEPGTGLCFNDVIKLDPSTWSWTQVDTTTGRPPARHSHCAATLKNDNLLIYGGASQQNTSLGDVWVFNIKSAEWKRIELSGCAPTAREMATLTALTPSKFLLFGGRSTERAAVLDDSALLDLDSCSWKQQATHQGFGRCAHTAVALPRSSVSQAILQKTESETHDDELADEAPIVIMYGGFTGTKVLGDVVLIDPRATSACQMHTLSEESGVPGTPKPRFAHAACDVPRSQSDTEKAMLVLGGMDPEQDLGDCFVWDAQ